MDRYEILLGGEALIHIPDENLRVTLTQGTFLKVDELLAFLLANTLERAAKKIIDPKWIDKDNDGL